MAIKGSLKEASLPDVLQLLALGQKTGCLSIADRSNFGYIYFEKGRICYASIVNRRDRLGDILVKHNRISQEQLLAAVQQQTKEHGKKLGQVLVAMEVLSQADLERYMRVQIEESVFYLFTWTQGTFNFEADVRPERQDFLVSINPESLLLEGARRVDEWSLIEKKIPSFDLIFALDKDRLAISEAKLTDTQQRLLPLLDGSRDVNEVIDDSGRGEFEIGKAPYGLITAGFVHRTGRTASAADAQITDARVEEHRNLGVAFYKTGMLDEAAREFRRVAELRPGEANAHFYMGLVALKQARWREAMETLRLAAEKGGGRPAVFHNLGFAYEQMGRLDEAESAYAEAAGRARTDAKVYLGWGVVALKRGDYASAAGRLDRSRELFGQVPPPAWFWARALTAAAAGEFEAAQELAEEAVEAYPSHAALLNNLAVLRELSGDLTGAEDMVRTARKNEPSLPQLSKNLGDLAYRGSRYDDAWEAYNRAVELAPDLGDDVYFKLGNIAYKRNERELALVPFVRDVAEFEVDVVPEIGRELHGPVVGLPRVVVSRSAVRQVPQVLGQLRERRLVLARRAHHVLGPRQVTGELPKDGQVVEERRVRWIGFHRLFGQLLGRLEFTGGRGGERPGPEPGGGRHLPEQLARAVEAPGGARVITPLQRHHAPPEVDLGVRARPPRRLGVGAFSLIQPAHLLVGEAQVVKHGRPPPALLRGEAQRLHRLAPARLLQGHETHVEMRVGLAGAQLGHAPEFACGFV